MYTYNHGDFLKGDLIQNIDTGTLFKVKEIEGETISLVNGTCYGTDYDYRPKNSYMSRVQIIDNDYSRNLIRLPLSMIKLRNGDQHNYRRISPSEISSDERITGKRRNEGQPVDWDEFDKNPDCFDPPMKPDCVDLL